METESLKAIINVLNSLGENSKDAFIWWIIIQNGATYLFGAIWSGIALAVIRYGYGLLRNYLISEKLREAAGVDYCWSDSQQERACEVLKKHYRV